MRDMYAAVGYGIMVNEKDMKQFRLKDGNEYHWTEIVEMNEEEFVVFYTNESQRIFIGELIQYIDEDTYASIDSDIFNHTMTKSDIVRIANKYLNYSFDRADLYDMVNYYLWVGCS